MISAKRNKEGGITVSGLINLDFYNIGVAEGGKELYIKSMNKEGFLIPIEDEKETEPKFIPTLTELKDFGFTETTWKTYFVNKDNTVLYSSMEKKLFRYEGMNDIEIPFHTKQDFMRIVGTEEEIKIQSEKKQEEYLDALLKSVVPLGEDVRNHIVREIIYYFRRTNVSDFKITYIPSEKTLVDLGFTRNLTGWDKKFFTELRYIGYTIADNEFEDEDGNALFLHSDSELKMLVDILSRES